MSAIAKINFSNLPSELQLKILSFLSTEEKFLFSRVNKISHALINDSSNWAVLLGLEEPHSKEIVLRKKDLSPLARIEFPLYNWVLQNPYMKICGVLDEFFLKNKIADITKNSSSGIKQVIHCYDLSAPSPIPFLTITYTFFNKVRINNAFPQIQTTALFSRQPIEKNLLKQTSGYHGLYALSSRVTLHIEGKLSQEQLNALRQLILTPSTQANELNFVKQKPRQPLANIDLNQRPPQQPFKPSTRWVVQSFVPEDNS